MNKKLRIFMASAMCLSMLAGCGGQSGTAQNTGGTSGASVQTEAAGSSDSAKDSALAAGESSGGASVRGK